MSDLILFLMAWFLSGFFMCVQIKSNCEAEGHYEMKLLWKNMGRIECKEMQK